MHTPDHLHGDVQRDGHQRSVKDDEREEARKADHGRVGNLVTEGEVHREPLSDNCV